MRQLEFDLVSCYAVLAVCQAAAAWAAALRPPKRKGRESESPKNPKIPKSSLKAAADNVAASNPWARRLRLRRLGLPGLRLLPAWPIEA